MSFTRQQKHRRLWVVLMIAALISLVVWIICPSADCIGTTQYIFPVVGIPALCAIAYLVDLLIVQWKKEETTGQ